MTDSSCSNDNDLSKYDKKRITILIRRNGREIRLASIAEFAVDMHLGPCIKLSLATYDRPTIFVQNAQNFVVDDKYGGDFIVMLDYT